MFDDIYQKDPEMEDEEEIGGLPIDETELGTPADDDYDGDDLAA